MARRCLRVSVRGAGRFRSRRRSTRTVATCARRRARGRASVQRLPVVSARRGRVGGSELRPALWFERFVAVLGSCLEPQCRGRRPWPSRWTIAWRARRRAVVRRGYRTKSCRGAPCHVAESIKALYDRIWPSPCPKEENRQPGPPETRRVDSCSSRQRRRSVPSVLA